MDSIISLGQKNTLAKYMILSGADNRPPMLDKDLEWGDQNKEICELSTVEKIHDDCDIKATNIILQGLPADIYSLVNHHRVAKDLWEIVQLLMQSTSLTKQERECKLYDAFDKFTHIKGESLHKYYLRFTQLINNMNIYNMKMEQFQVNIKFLSNLPPEWSKSLVMMSSFERNQDPLAFVANQQMTPPHFNTWSQLQQFRGRQGQSYSDTGYKSNATSSGGNNASGQARVVKCYNCQDPGVPNGQFVQTIIPNNAAFQTEDLDTYYSDCDDISNAKAVLMDNISNYGLDNYLEVVSCFSGYLDSDVQTHMTKRTALSLDILTKDEAPKAIIKCIKNIQVRLNATVRNVRTDNGTEFVNSTLCEFYENIGISHQTSIDRTSQQNAKAINTACYTQNRSLNRLRYNKTPYELMQDKKPDLSFFHVFGALCYPTNDNDDLVLVAAAPRVVVLADSPVSTSIDQDAPSTSIPSTQDILETFFNTFL
ncbi:retrovirus-related pol polyprotein from transposon TNT 1-94 [Tanacetum coccineum]